MLLRLATSFGISLFLIAPAPASASEPCHGCPPPPIEKTATTTQVLLVPHEKAITVPSYQLREVEIGRGKSGPVLDFQEQKQCVTEMKLESREVEQQVVVTESRPITVTDPCTGKCRTEYQPCQVVKRVKVKVYEVVPVQREVVVRVPVLKPGPEVVIKQYQVDKTTQPAVERRYEALTTHNPVKAVMPSCPVVPPGH